MRTQESLVINVALISGLLIATMATSATMKDENEPEVLAKQGWSNFLEVLGGEQSKFELALGQLEQAATAAPTDVHNLYTLGRAYFYDAIAHNHLASAEKAERAFAHVLELDPGHDALAFHGSVLTILSRGNDLEKFQQGVQEMHLMVRQDPDNLTARLSRGLTALALQPKARVAMGKYDPVEDLEFANRAFEGIQFRNAPHAEVGAKIFVGEAYLLRGDVAKARGFFRAALAVPLPPQEDAKAGRALLQGIVQKCMDDSQQSLSELLTQAGLGSCNVCHLRVSEKVQSLSKTSVSAAVPVTRVSQTPQGLDGAESELRVEIVGLRSREGQVRVALFDSEQAFLQKPFKTGIIPTEPSQCYWQVSGLRTGWHALAVYHDRNGNGELDRNFLGIPLEPYGFSNDARGVIGPPSFSDARFQVSGSTTRIEVRLE